MTKDEMFMTEALSEAQKAFELEEVPIGCVIVKDDQIIARAHNLKESTKRASAHAEVLAINDASAVIGGWRLTDCDLYVTIEPCAMCAGLIYQSRVRRVIFGSFDYRGGACGGSMNVLESSQINHHVEITSGILKNECSDLVKLFFKNRR